MTLEITEGVDDTDEGIKLKVKVVDDDYPRIHLTPQGAVKVGDGTEAPTEVSLTVPAATGVTYENSWDDVPGAQPVTYTVDRGRCHVGGVCTGGASGTVAFTLPEGARPSGVLVVAHGTGNGTDPYEVNFLTLADDGTVTLSHGTGLVVHSFTFDFVVA